MWVDERGTESRERKSERGVGGRAERTICLSVVCTDEKNTEEEEEEEEQEVQEVQEVHEQGGARRLAEIT